MNFKTEQEAFWAGQFGTEYIGRNTSKEFIASNLNFFTKALNQVGKPESLIEFGANVGMNLLAIKLLFPSIELHGIEINEFYKEHTPETVLEVLAIELLTTGSLILGTNDSRRATTVTPFPLRKYPQEQFRLQRMPDAASVSPTPTSQTVLSISGELLDHNPASESWQTTEETRSGNWETVRRQQRGSWKGVPPLPL